MTIMSKLPYREDMAKKQRVFITMCSNPDMTIFDWERHIEEVQAALVHTVANEDWDQLQVFGPNTGSFSPPAICFQVNMTVGEVGNLMENLAVSAPWLSVPVAVHVTTSTMTVGEGNADALPGA